jgi:hypothetical protein
MDTNLAVAVVDASATMVTGVFGMWINASQTGKRIDEVGNRIDDFRTEFHLFRTEIKSEINDLRTELTTFKDLVNGKLQRLGST